MKEMWEIQERINKNVQEQITALGLIDDLLNKRCDLLQMKIEELEKKLSEKES